MHIVVHGEIDDAVSYPMGEDSESMQSLSVLPGILIVYGVLSRGGLKTVESLLAMVGLLVDEKEFLFHSHSRSHDGMGTDSIVANTGFA
jgi:hypothetical protein